VAVDEFFHLLVSVLNSQNLNQAELGSRRHHFDSSSSAAAKTQAQDIVSN